MDILAKRVPNLTANINIILPIVLATILPVISLYANDEKMYFEKINFFQSWLIAFVFLYVLWYLLWPLWNLKANYKYILMLLVPAVYVVVVLHIAFWLAYGNLERLEVQFIARMFLASVLFLTIQYSLKVQQNIAALYLEKEQIQTENYKAQLKALQAKVDPHFLFNSLNTLRSMVRQNHLNSEKFIISLSDFFRQTLKHNENTTLELFEELAVLESYLFLMKNRNEEAISFDLSIDPALHQYRLPTLGLQIVVENCFKHNSMTSRMPLRIEIKNTADFYITVKNNIQPKIGDTDSTGYGLDLLRKRYELLNIKNGLVIEETPDYFTAKLKLI